MQTKIHRLVIFSPTFSQSMDEHLLRLLEQALAQIQIRTDKTAKHHAIRRMFCFHCQ